MERYDCGKTSSLYVAVKDGGHKWLGICFVTISLFSRNSNRYHFLECKICGCLPIEKGISEGFDSCDRTSNLTQIGFKSSIFQPVWPWNSMDDPKNTGAPLLCYFELCAAFRSHWWIQTGVTVRKRPIWVQFNDFRAVWTWNLTDDLLK